MTQDNPSPTETGSGEASLEMDPLARIQELERQLAEAQAAIQSLKSERAIEFADGPSLLYDQHLNDSEKWLFTVLEHLPVGVWLANEKGEIIYGNPAGRKIWAGAKYVGPDEFHEYKAWWYDTGKPLESYDWAVARAVMHKQTSLNEVILIECFDGSTKVILNSAVPMLGEDGSILGAAVLNEDITERKQSEAALQANAEKLERSNRDLEQFAFLASHDLQEPLRKIEMFGEMLTRKSWSCLDEDGRGYLKRMNDASGRMRQMISALLALSRVTTEGRPFRKVKLSKIVENVVDDLDVRLKESAAEIQVDELPAVRGDAIQMHQLFQNLVSNAIKFTRPEVPPRVHIYTRPVEADQNPESSLQARRLVEVVVEDNGIGIHPEHVEQIFRPFHRLHGRSEYEGFGIGLAVCQKIVERHGGSLMVESTPGQGSKFVVCLPEAGSSHSL
jgi:signal transduction histidine kinase